MLWVLTRREDPLTEEAQRRIREVRKASLVLLRTLHRLAPSGQAADFADAKVVEARMWASEAIALNHDQLPPIRGRQDD